MNVLAISGPLFLRRTGQRTAVRLIVSGRKATVTVVRRSC